MKKKLLILSTAGFCILLMGAAVMFGTGNSPHTGTYIRATNGEHLVVVGNSPIIMLNENESQFSSLHDGDKILVFYGNIDTVFPSQAQVNVFFKLGEGDISDIPEHTWTELEQLGWVAP